ncbi:hypothetical protein SSPO_003520 [Streptomyces antimycoticus]|uniref:Alpha-L-arabinofuranosidase B catalytic domain-containing protein n=1 Tax=Streptomyces antimycoticus TaxID=68175 RepID=A0A499UA70_9ACTN|nr:hypothetical protein SSPO_003520 [Streptomyces antimycoticus]
MPSLYVATWTTLTDGRRMRDGTADDVAGDRADMVGIGDDGDSPPDELGVGAVSGRQRGGHQQPHRGHPVGLRWPKQPEVEHTDTSARVRRVRTVRHVLEGGTPCVAAHSTVGALYGSYSGSLYQVRRSSDNATRDIGVLAPGGVANAAAQDSFCAGTSCVITAVYDQSGHGNDLWYQGSAQVPGSSQSRPAKATSESLTAGGTKAYSVHQPREQLLAGRSPYGRVDRCRTRRGVHGDQRHPRQQRLLLRLRQQ